MPARLSVVIPSHNRADLLRLCLASVLRRAPAGTEVVVVDDASPEGAASDAAAAFHGVRVLRQPRARRLLRRRQRGNKCGDSSHR